MVLYLDPLGRSAFVIPARFAGRAAEMHLTESLLPCSSSHRKSAHFEERNLEELQRRSSTQNWRIRRHPKVLCFLTLPGFGS